MDVSIAMATYNGARFLPEQLESLRCQQHVPVELVVNDDGSTDETAEIVLQFARTAPFAVSFERNPVRLGFADNFLLAAARCRGDVVAFCDQDDVWHPTKLARAVAVLALEPEVALVGHDATLVDAEGRPTGVLRHKAPAGRSPGWALLPQAFFFGLTMTFRRELLELVPDTQRPFDLVDPARPLAHDRWVSFLAAISADVYFINESLVDYRQHDTNASGGMTSGRGWVAVVDAARTKFGYTVMKQLAYVQRELALVRQVVTDDAPTAARLERALDVLEGHERQLRLRFAIPRAASRPRRFAAVVTAWRGSAYGREGLAEGPVLRVLRDLALATIAAPGQEQRARALLGPRAPDPRNL
ncbi:glycosyltransferase family 2 protein [Lapillicoccus sp.]|uniref:glycosyltransferase family 2 protein n=1 Tax=Lapillicoccus sp. TaxID=1909287 RepID=UPI0025F89AF4|nr:glycosyltransferase family 2 protein [Lapillicoccus sp.]